MDSFLHYTTEEGRKSIGSLSFFENRGHSLRECKRKFKDNLQPCPFSFFSDCAKILKKEGSGEMSNCVIFCAAEFDALARPLAPEDFVIAADGGLRHTQALGITPDEVLGDFDSLGFIPEDARVFPVEKDDTDAMLAVRRGLSLGYREFYLYGSLDGPRLDHTVANFQTLQFLADHGAAGYLIGKNAIVTVVKNGSILFPAQAEGLISVFCMGADARGVTETGLYYTLDNGVLTSGFPLGASNHFTGKESRISVDDGSLLIIWERKAGFPAARQSALDFGR